MGQANDKVVGREGIAFYFEKLLEKHGDSHLSLDWNSKLSQELRYAVFLEIIGYTNKAKDFSILDVGCGLGHFYDYLKKNRLIREFGIRYSGIDISEKLISSAKLKNPDVPFHAVDLLEGKFNKKADFVMASGVFSIRIADAETHKECVYRMLSRMFSLAKTALAVNFICRDVIYSTTEDPKNSRYVYFTPEEIIGFCKTLTKKYMLRHDYHPSDFTVYLFR